MGTRRGSHYKKWTEQENEILQAFLLGPNADCKPYSHLLSPLLPGRSNQDIRNGLNTLRRRLSSTCAGGCGSGVSIGGTQCDQCKQDNRAARVVRLAQGRCGNCGVELDDTSSATLCTRCREYHSKYNFAYAKRKTPNKPSSDVPGIKMFDWPRCGSAKFVARFLSKANRPVVDLCGGAAEFLRLFSVFSGGPHNIHAYYDINPAVHSIMDHIINGAELTHTTLMDGLQSKTSKRNIKLIRKSLAGISLSCASAMDVLKCNRHPHNTVYICDPPWPGTSSDVLKPYDTMDYEGLFTHLSNLPGGQDFVLSLGAERLALRYASRWLRGARLFRLRTTHAGSQSVIALTPKMVELSGLEGTGQEVFLDKLGIHNES